MSNEKEVTIYDIARKLNISPATVSRGLTDHPAISKKTKKMIFDQVEKMDIDQTILPAISAIKKRTR